MYFSSKNENTNIDSEFKSNKFNFSDFDFKKLKWPMIILGGILLLIILLIVIINIIGNNSKVYYFIDLLGEEEITIYKDSDYVELGYEAYDNKNNDLTEQVQINSTVDTSVIGEYEVVYSLNDVTVTRYVTVIEKPVGATYIYLKGDLTVYLDVSDEYTEPGYLVVDTVDSNLTDKVEISSDLDVSKAGTYKIVYSVVNSSGVTTSAIRTVIVMNSQMSLSLDNTGYTNSSVNINVYITDNYFDYLVLPNGEKVSNNTYSYKVVENGTYNFKFYNKHGTEKEESITVSNIDKSAPTGSCSGYFTNDKTVITITGKDASGISKYKVDNNVYSSNKITVNSKHQQLVVVVYDKAGNSSNVACQLTDKTDVIPPTGICKISYYNGNSIITVNANDESQISSYKYSGKEYTSNKINVSKIINNAVVSVFDEHGNYADFTCSIAEIDMKPLKGVVILDGDIDYSKQSGTVKINPSTLGCTFYYMDTGVEYSGIKINASAANSLRTILRNVCEYSKRTPWYSKVILAGAQTGNTGMHGAGLAIDMNNTWIYTSENGTSYRPYPYQGASTWNQYEKFICEVCGGVEDCKYNVNYQLWKLFYEPLGWCWGGNWGTNESGNRFDPMHFEYKNGKCWVKDKYKINCDN